MDNPGGDAADPQEVALERQLKGRWGYGPDKDNQLLVPMVDAGNYERVRYWVVDHFVGFRYGTDYHALNAVFVLDVPEGEPTDSRSCLSRVEKWGRPQLKNFEVRLGMPETSEATWRDQTVYVRTVDGHVDFGFERLNFSTGYAAYPAYPNACMVFAFVVPWRKHPDLAREVLDRWVREGVPRLRPLTATRPYRK
jgi:hypothetical protein